MTHREKWLDISKGFACILIVLGHLLRGLGGAGVVDPDGVSGHIIDVIYFFHVQVFFFCSGYLHQKRGKKGIAAHGKRVLKKLVDLGVPYVAFTTVSVLLRTLFDESVNNPVSKSLFRTLFVKPDAPYWYLYVLFFMFLITPKLSKKKTASILLAVAAAAHIVYGMFFSVTPLPYAVKSLMEFWVWFVFGMFASKLGLMEKRISLGKCIPYLLFIPLSFAVSKFNVTVLGVELIMGALGIAMTTSFALLLARRCFKRRDTSVLTKYTMPIFLMHTMASPAVRAVLLRLGVTNPLLHIVLGMAAGILLPVAAAYVMEKTVVLEFFTYPIKTVKKLKRKRS